MKSEKGFAIVLLLSLLPVIIAGGLFMFAGFGLLRADLSNLNLCRQVQLQAQEKAAMALKKILDMNPKALKLRLEFEKTQKLLEAAVRSGNGPAISVLTARLVFIRWKQSQLDLQQRALIEKTNLQLKLSWQNLKARLSQGDDLSHKNNVTGWTSSVRLGKEKIPKLAVKPDALGLAPLYHPVPGFEEAQAWQQSWELRSQSVSWAAKFLKWKGGFKRSCSTSIYPEGSLWSAKLRKDRFLSKVFF